MCYHADMDIVTGENTSGGGASAMNQPDAEPSTAAAYGNDQSDEECPRYMLAGRLTETRRVVD